MNFYGDLYDRLYEHGYHQSFKYGGDAFVRFLLDRYSFQAVLDVGAGKGGGLLLLQKAGKEATGVDVAADAIAGMQKKNLNCVKASATGLPYGDAQFDLVLACDFMEHLRPEDVDQALSEFTRVSRRYIALQIGVSRAKRSKGNDPIASGFPFKNIHLTVWKPDIWKGQLQRNGWKIILFTQDMPGSSHKPGKHLWVVMEKAHA